MSFYTDRSAKLESFIFNEVSKRPELVSLAIVFLDKDPSPIVYKLSGNKYKKAYLNTLLWGEEQWLYDLTWEEKKKIKDNLFFVEPNKVDVWLQKKKRSVLVCLFSKVREKMNKL